MIKMPIKFYVDGIGRGLKLYDLDSANAGEDDVILAASKEEALNIVLDYIELPSLPVSWSLREITVEEFYANLH